MMNKEYTRTCQGDCGAELDSESADVVIGMDGDLTCRDCHILKVTELMTPTQVEIAVQMYWETY